MFSEARTDIIHLTVKAASLIKRADMKEVRLGVGEKNVCAESSHDWLRFHPREMDRSCQTLSLLFSFIYIFVTDQLHT